MWLRPALKLIALLSVFSACSPRDRQAVDKLNSLSYAYHYRNLDSTDIYAQQAFDASPDYADGRAEALNNLAFVDIMRMDYTKAKEHLDAIPSTTDNQIELLVCNVQQMRLCQRMSENRNFYDYRGKAQTARNRIAEEQSQLTERQLQRLAYAESELAIVTSTYYYYIGLERQSVQSLRTIDDTAIKRDTAQYLNYLYNLGAGGMITASTQYGVKQQEFGLLVHCYQLARESHMPYFEANSLEALAELLTDSVTRRQLTTDNPPAIKLINTGDTPDRLLPRALADSALDLFQRYGDTYQIAGAFRTLASCYRAEEDIPLTLDNLKLALSDSAIFQAPDLIASIYEQLSVAYAAVDSMPISTDYRQRYLGLQQETRQDRSREARAQQLDTTVTQLNKLLIAVVVAILLLVALLAFFYYLNRRTQKRNNHIDELMQPLRDWERENRRQMEALSEKKEELSERQALAQLHIENNERRHLEQRAKISLVNSITPFIDRMLYEVHKASSHEGLNKEYVCELTDKINEQNDVLTHWIQLRKGELSLHIETFALQQLFDIIGKSKMGFLLKGITLNIRPTEARVKADKVLTLFMLNTLADNARKFTPEGGLVTIDAKETADYVEIAVSDTGVGIDAEQLPHIFDHSVTGGHGFGLMNCKGIIEKYRKISQIFSVCQLSAESRIGQGSRFFFRLPKGIVRLLVLLVSMLSFSQQPAVAQIDDDLKLEALTKAGIYADYASQVNEQSHYEQTLLYADTCRQWLNRYYLLCEPGGSDTLRLVGNMTTQPAELTWYYAGLDTHYDQILAMRNSTAIAALALHQWNVYSYNNRIYTLLYKEISADDSLDEYCRKMQKSQSNKQIAIIVLVVLLISILPVFYLLFVRHRLYYRFCVERINTINGILLSEASDEEKRNQIAPLLSERFPEQLQQVVSQIQQSLSQSVTVRQNEEEQIELAEDELQRAEMEEGNLHVSNAVLDNCLSTLKHETMYYPSRIRQLVDTEDIDSLKEVTSYYRELYGILSEQAMRQIEHVKLHLKPLRYNILGDKTLIDYLFEILRKQGGGQPLAIEARPKDQRYVELRVPMPALELSEQQAAQLFLPSTENIPYLLCRQIVRDHGEATNRRGCGIWAELIDKQTTIIIILPICRTSKSSS